MLVPSPKLAIGTLAVVFALQSALPNQVADAGHAQAPSPQPTQPAIAAAQVEADAPVTQEFGERPEAYAKFGVKGHTGRDIGIDCGQPVQAHANAVVKLVGDDPQGYGNFVVSQDNLGYQHMQGHFSSIAVKQGDYISQGQEIGKAGKSGNSTGCHEHWGVRGASKDNGYGGYIDPRDWLAMRQQREQNKSCVYDVPKPYADVICQAVQKYPADPAAVAAFLYWEHRGFEASPETYNWAGLCSGAGACGAGQFMPATWKAYGVDGDGDGKAERGSFKDSVYSAAHLIGKYTGTTPDADAVGVAAIKYNCGPSCVGKPLPNETAEYKKAVVNLWWKFSTN